MHWSKLPQQIDSHSSVSLWPPLLRWLEVHPLELLERVVLISPVLQRYVVERHRRALKNLLAELPPVGRVTIVGGGLFPRTALVLRELLPSAEITIVDANPRHLEIARGMLGPTVVYRNQHYSSGGIYDSDLTVIPLCLDGDRAAIYRHPPSAFVMVHDWIWRRRGLGAVVSIALMKRINLVRFDGVRR
jgi:hypothetical protein